MTIFYLSAYAYIKEKPFDVWAPAFYFPLIPDSMKDTKPKPLEKPNPFKMVSTVRHNPTYMRQMEDPNQMQRARFTTEILVDMFQRKIDFEFVHDEDVVDMFENIDRYLVSIKNDVELGDEKIVKYAKLIMSFRERLYHLYYRYMKLHPEALEKLYPNNNPTENIMYLMMQGGTSRVDANELDPLLAKRRPPYRIDKILPTSSDGEVKEVTFESHLGPSATMDIKDDGSDFNFDDFLKRN